MKRSYKASGCKRSAISNQRPDIGKKSIISLSLIFIFCFILFSIPCEALTAGRIEIRGLQTIGEQELLDVFDLREGSLIDRDKVRSDIKRAFLKGIFEDISVEVSDGDNPSVIINVREKDFLDRVHVTGDHSISEKVIKQNFLLKEGQVMRYDLIETAVREMKETLAYIGFPDSRVEVKVVGSKKPYRVDIYLNIDTGPPLIIKRIVITGAAGDAKSIMKLSVGDVYNQQALMEEIRRLKENYKEQGYFSPTIGPYSYKEGELELIVNPGRLLNVRTEGNNIISTRKLLKEVPFFEIETFNDEAVEEAISRMLFLYHREGYPTAQIAPVINLDEKNIDISFFIFEGERVKIKSINFNGVALPHKRLKDVMFLKEGDIFDPDFTAKDRESLKEFYGALGYLDVDIREIETKIDKESNTAELVVNIDEGKKTEIASVEINVSDPEMKSRLMSVLGIKPGDPYNEIDISDARFRILEFYSSYGYTSIDVTVTRSVENYKASVIFSVTADKKRLFGKTIITGNRDTKYEVIRRELLHKEGQPYNLRTLSEERQRLYKLGLFTDVEIEAVDGEGDKKDILIKVKEGNAGSVEFGFGYAEYESFRSYIELSYRNLWGKNRQGLLRAEISSLERRFILQYYEPWFLGKPLPLRVFFLHENKKVINIADKNTRYRLDRYSLAAALERKISDKVKTELYYEFSLVRTSDVQPDVILSKEDTGTLAISSIRPAVIYDTRDNLFEPTKGIIAGISLKAASFLLLSETNFAKLEIYGSSFHKLNKRVTLALSLRGGVAYGFGKTNELPIVERFFLGGRSTVRGYEQDTLGPKGSDGNPTGGNAFIMGNVEFRTSIGRGFGLVPFLDMGNVWINAKNLDPTDLKYTAGIGLRYNTPVGPIRVDYGIKLKKEPHESKGALHFSIGHAF